MLRRIRHRPIRLPSLIGRYSILAAALLTYALVFYSNELLTGAPGSDESTFFRDGLSLQVHFLANLFKSVFQSTWIYRQDTNQGGAEMFLFILLIVAAATILALILYSGRLRSSPN
ncbi:hypothetical protein ACFL4G_11685, partial [Thermodesulfobacteriota bacterium]